MFIFLVDDEAQVQPSLRPDPHAPRSNRGLEVVIEVVMEFVIEVLIEIVI